MPSSAAQELSGGEAGAVERLGAVEQRLRAAQHGPLLGQADQLGAVGGSLAHQALGYLEVSPLVIGRVELNCGGPHGLSSPRPKAWLTDQSIGGEV
jgi:hypothetical protein